MHNVNIEASFLHGPHAYICNDHDAIIVTKLRFGLLYVCYYVSLLFIIYSINLVNLFFGCESSPISRNVRSTASL